MNEFVSKAELAQSFQRYKPFPKLLMKFRVRDKGSEILKVKRNLLSLTEKNKNNNSWYKLLNLATGWLECFLFKRAR